MENLLNQKEKEDIQLLNEMGFDKNMINKIYILLRPEKIEKAIELMIEINGKYQHDFIYKDKKNENTLCFICENPKENHLNSKKNFLLNDNNNNNIAYMDTENDSININKTNILNNNNISIYGECKVCFGEMDQIDNEFNKISCGHLFCTSCWFNYLKSLISEGKVDKIKCMDYECNEYISEDFILKHILENSDLVDKYKRFKKRDEIINDENKKICPFPDCESFIKKSNSSKYVECEYGHKYCFECLNPPHGDKPCELKQEKKFMKWIKGKRVKRCPKCKMYTEKNEGCNHMTCVKCNYEWCWICEEEYNPNHYESGKCKGQSNIMVDNLQEVEANRNAFGLHKIFKCVYRPIYGPIDFSEINLGLLYFLMLLFLLFGFLILYAFLWGINYKQILPKKKHKKLFNVILFGLGSILFIPFQFSFTCVIFPFILIAAIYNKFLGRILLFFGIGEYERE